MSLRSIPGGGDDWRSRLLTSMVPTGDGKWKSVTQKSSPNVTTILRYHPHWREVLAYDAFAERVILTRPAPWCEEDAPGKREEGTWSETDALRLVAWLAREERLYVKAGTALEGVSVAAEATHVHPVRDYLESLRWDAQFRTPTWLTRYCCVADTPYAREVGRRWLISAVARVMRPGCQVDCMLVFESKEQGRGKSRALRALVPDSRWHSETGVTIGDKDSYQSLHGIWIYVFDELGSTRKSDVAKVKNFITATKDHYRPSYARLARDFARQTVFAGTIDEEEYLTDRAGNRRYWPVRIEGDVDVLAIVRDRDQIWAEAFAAYQSGAPWHVDTPELRAMCEEAQRARVHSDPWEPIVATWLARNANLDGVTVTEVLQGAIGKDAKDITTGDGTKAAAVLRSLGYERGPRRWESGAEVRRYTRAQG